MTSIAVAAGAGADPRDLLTARELRDRIRERCGLELAIESREPSADAGRGIELHHAGGGGCGYTLHVEREGIAARGTSSQGLRYATETLLQLVRHNGSLLACHIEDEPDFARRGLLVDVSRGKVPSAATLRDMVDFCVALKFDALLLYVEHTFQFHRHPDIGAGASPLGAAEVRELDAYAADRHVELVPCLQSLGHMERILSLPGYAHLAESEARWSLSPALEESYALLRDLYDEFLPAFRSPLFHANCDEPWDLGRGHSADREREGGPGTAFVEHVHRVQAMAAERGRRTMIWADFAHAHPERLAELDRELILCDWGYEADEDCGRADRLRALGFSVWVCPGTSSWNALYPRLSNAFANIAAWARAGRQAGAEGFLVTDWGDFGHYNLWGNSQLAVAWAAQQAWSGDESPSRFDRAASALLYGTRHGGPARLQRELGAIHEVGFTIANGSPLAFLYFDDLERGDFVRGADAKVVARTGHRLAKLRQRLVESLDDYRGDLQSYRELFFAVEASCLAATKADFGLPYMQWRSDLSQQLSAELREILANGFDKLVALQREHADQLCELWRARNEPGHFDVTVERLEGSMRDLARAARELRENRRGRPPPPHPGFSPRVVLAALRRATGWPPPPPLPPLGSAPDPAPAREGG